MDPEVQRELEEQFRRLSEMMAQQSEIQASLNKSLQDQLRLQPGAAAATKKNTDALNSNSTAVGGNTRLQEIEAENSLKAQKAVDSFKTGIEKAGNAVFSFTKTFISGEEGFKKYSNAMDSAGSAAWNIGKEFGIIGKVLGGLGAVAGKVAGTYLKQADDLLTATDSLAKLGAGATLTVEEVRQMGKGAGLASGELDKLIKPMQSIKGGFLGLGDSATAGIKKFGELSAVSEDVRKEFQRLGMGDQERNQALADYVTMLNKSGAIASGSLKTQQGLQKAALDYTRNLYELAQLTGEDVEAVKAKNEAAMSSIEVTLMMNKLESERATAIKNGDKATEERINKEIAGINSFTKELMQAGASQDQIVAAQNQFLTGAITEQSAKFAMWGVNMDEYIQKHKEGSAVPGEFAQAYKEGAQGFIDSVGQGTLGLSKELVDISLGAGAQEFVGNLTKRIGRDEADAAATAAAENRANQEEKSAAALDAAQINRSELTEAERQARLAVDELVASTNPLLNANLNLAEKFEKLKELIGFVIDNLKTIGIVIGSVIAGLLGFKIIKGVIGMFRGLSAAGKGLSSVFKGLKAAFNSAIGWLRNLLPGGKSKSSPGPKKGADGRYRDAKGRFAAAPSAGSGSNAAKLAKGGARILGKLALPLTAVMAGYDAYQGFTADPNASFGGKMANAGKSALSGMTFGLSDYVTGGVTVGTPEQEKAKDKSASKKSVDEATVTAEKLRAQLFPGGTQAERTTEKLRLEREAAAAGDASVLTPEETKELAEKSKEDAQTNNSSATLTEAAAIKNEATAVTTKKSTELFDKSTDKQEKTVNKEGRVIDAFGTSVYAFALAVQSFAEVITNLMTNLSTMTGVSSGPGGGAASGEKIPQNVQGNLEAIAQGLRKKGFGDENYINAVLGNVMKESGGKFDKTENLDYSKTSNARIRDIFKSMTKGMSDAELDKLKADPQAFTNKVYGGRMGNTEPGDGWKYRGRGPIQLTGKSNYAKASKDIYGDDRLVKDPDLVLQPDVGVEVVAWFMKQNEKSMRKQLGFSPDQALSQQEAALLATSQIAGQKLTPGKGYLGTENLQKAASFAAAMPTGVGAGGQFSSGGQGGAANPASKELISTKPSNVKLGDKADLSGMDSNLLSRFFTAAKEFGQNININSAYRNDDYQAQLWVRGNILGEKGIYTPARPKDDTTITYKGKQYTVEGSGTGSRHGRGEALDISTNRVAFDPILAKYGLHRPFANDPPHVQLKARKGGVFTGPDSGYPIELHGQEIVAPLTADSVLMKLAKTPAVSAEGDRLGTSVMSLGGGSSAGNGNVEAIVKMHSELISVLTSKLDNMIDVLDDGNDTREKIFKHSMV